MCSGWPMRGRRSRRRSRKREPPSVRTAAGVIVTATAVVVIAGGALMRVLDHDEYANVWVGMWWALQTVTTVGYGDVTPHHTSGRIVAAFVMLSGKRCEAGQGRDSGQDPLAVVRVQPRLVSLRHTQGPGLVPDRARHTDSSKIMQVSRDT